jgi:hypothetical protein
MSENYVGVCAYVAMAMWQGAVWQGPARLGRAWPGEAGQGSAWHGEGWGPGNRLPPTTSAAEGGDAVS